MRVSDVIYIVLTCKMDIGRYWLDDEGLVSYTLSQNSACGDRGSIPGRDIPKLLLHCQTLGNSCECHGSSEMTIIKGWPVSQAFNGNSDVSKWVKNSPSVRKTLNKKIPIQCWMINHLTFYQNGFCLTMKTFPLSLIQWVQNFI